MYLSEIHIPCDLAFLSVFGIIKSIETSKQFLLDFQLYDKQCL